MKDKIVGKIIRCAHTVADTLGTGFLEEVYVNALAHELRKNGLDVNLQSATCVHYDGIVVGEYVSGLLVENEILVELKTVSALEKSLVAQYRNYLRATGLKICLLINFGVAKIEVKRMVNNLCTGDFFDTGMSDLFLGAES